MLCLRITSLLLLLLACSLSLVKCHFFATRFFGKLIPSKRVSNTTVGKTEAASVTGCNLACLNKKPCISTLFTISKNKCVLLKSFFKDIKDFGETTGNDKLAKVIESRSTEPCSLLPCPEDITCSHDEERGAICRFKVNLARGKPTLQSSLAHNGVSSRAVDGNKSPDWNQNSCMHTDLDPRPWWRVDLRSYQKVKKVTLTGRGDVHGERVGQIDIFVGNIDGDPFSPENKLCAFYPGKFDRTNPTINMECLTPIYGRYVYVALRIKEKLMLCEVEVFGIKGAGVDLPQNENLSGNIAKGKDTQQSSFAAVLSSRAVDGKMDTNWETASCILTLSEPKPWWRVNLGSVQKVKKVVIINRAGWVYLREVKIKVGIVDSMPDNNSLCMYFRGTVDQGTTMPFECSKALTGRYIFVVLNVTVQLSLCEVQVFAEQGGGEPIKALTVNLARGKPAMQSSTLYAAAASRAVDGNHKTIFGENSCIHTNLDLRPWWRVDLESYQKVMRVRLTSRSDCCWDYLVQIDITVGNMDGDPLAKENKLCTHHHGQFEFGGQTKDLDCQEATLGRYVFVSLHVQKYLIFCEVEVFALKGAGVAVEKMNLTGNIAKGKDTQQSSFYPGVLSSRAVDGKMVTIWETASCILTFSEPKPWWRVNLGSVQRVKKVVIVNRAGWVHLREVKIKVGIVDSMPDKNRLCMYFRGTVDQGTTMQFECSKALTGRYVFVVLNVAAQLSLCEVQVFAVQGGVTPIKALTVNLARGKPAMQSSTLHNAVASKAVDGSNKTAFGENSCIQTDLDLRPWWRVDLGSYQKVMRVRLTSRSDCCWDHLVQIDIKVGNMDGDPLAKENKLCTHHRGQFEFAGQTKDLDCQEATLGRYVFVSLRVKKYLIFCEVEVFALKGAGVALEKMNLTENIARGKETKQSSTVSNTILPARAVDGNNDTNWNAQSCSQTKKELNPWWMVNLGSVQPVKKVVITNRGDCCHHQLRLVEVRVGNVDGKPNNNTLCMFFRGYLGAGETATFECADALNGRFVFVALRATEQLTLCEVQVYAIKQVNNRSGNRGRGPVNRGITPANGGMSPSNRATQEED